MPQPNVTIDLSQYLAPPIWGTETTYTSGKESAWSSALKLLTRPFAPLTCGAHAGDYDVTEGPQARAATSTQLSPTSNMSPTRNATPTETWSIEYELPENVILTVGQRVRLWCRNASAAPRAGIISTMTGHTNSEVHFLVREDPPNDYDLTIYLRVPIHATSLVEGSGILHWMRLRFILQRKLLGDQNAKLADDQERGEDMDDNIEGLEITTTLPTRTDTEDQQRSGALQEPRCPVASSGATATSAIIALGQTARVHRGNYDSPQKKTPRMASTSTLKDNTRPLGRQHVRQRSHSAAAATKKVAPENF
ncbi:hypothetical protein BKA70DRAFT_1240775 [Coprinopsis sp. MPI-PUGE-AT-0042]|nr:hypothetical protein BKA70DRAFT_1240775 [Coprinopsis sp. MPI-PUGE-AT-0042]